MNKRLLLIPLVMTSLLLATAEERYQTIGWDKNWITYDCHNEMRRTSLRGYVKIGDATYLCDDYDNMRHYRQEGEKVYCYDANKGKESLLFDFGMKQGDTFAITDLVNLEVERVCDTTIITPLFRDSVVCRKLYLRGVENPNYTDTWIEHVGSIHYGIKRPETLDEVSDMLLVMGDLEPITGAYVNDFRQDNVRGQLVTFKHSESSGHDTPGSDLYFRLSNDTLYVSGTLTNDHALMYVIVVEEENKILWKLHEIGVQFDSYLSFDIEMAIPGFTQESYVLYDGERAIANITATSLTAPSMGKSPSTPYYDLQGRPVANPTQGIYIKDGRKVIFNSEF